LQDPAFESGRLADRAWVGGEVTVLRRLGYHARLDVDPGEWLIGRVAVRVLPVIVGGVVISCSCCSRSSSSGLYRLRIRRRE
jgi:hypothetical protein